MPPIQPGSSCFAAVFLFNPGALRPFLVTVEFSRDADSSLWARKSLDRHVNHARSRARVAARSCDPLHVDTTPPLTTRQSERCEEVKELEASIEGAMRGNWRDLRTVFNAIGLTPRKPPASHQVAPRKKVTGG